jgi:catechol 2,3-dioxygenase-like lactoylglutathione lyase family enzyme
MQFNHIHVKVRDLPAAIAWMRDVWNVKPDFENDRMASLPLGSFWLFLDCAAEDTMTTVGFGTDDCDRDYKALAQRGAEGLEEPADRPWGARTAYIQGPGRLRFELEQALTETAT